MHDKQYLFFQNCFEWFGSQKNLLDLQDLDDFMYLEELAFDRAHLLVPKARRVFDLLCFIALVMLVLPD